MMTETYKLLQFQTGFIYFLSQVVFSIICMFVLNHPFPVAPPLAASLHICVELEFISLVSYGEVALGDPVPAGLKGHLVSSQPALVAYHPSTVNGCTINVVVHITAQVDVVALESRLQLAALFADKMERENC